MSIIHRILNCFTSKQEDTAAESPAMDLEKIWNLADKTDFLMAINERLNARSSYGEYLERLSAEEQVFYICNLLEEEVNNGGKNIFEHCKERIKESGFFCLLSFRCFLHSFQPLFLFLCSVIHKADV